LRSAGPKPLSARDLPQPVRDARERRRRSTPGERPRRLTTERHTLSDKRNAPPAAGRGPTYNVRAGRADDRRRLRPRSVTLSRPKIAVLKTRPQSVVEDYARLMRLASYRSVIDPSVP